MKDKSEKKLTKTHDELMQEELQDKEMQILWLRGALKEYIEDGNYEKFYRSIKYVIKARAAITQLAKELNMNRGNLSEILNGKIEPKMQTAFKILDALGYKLTLEQKAG